jgi:hypothetical protein
MVVIVKAFLSGNLFANLVQFGILVISIFALIALFKNLYSLNEQLSTAQKELELTQALNQPLCGIKELRVEKVRDNVVQLTPVVKNFGKTMEKDALYKWKIDRLENFNSDKVIRTPLLDWKKIEHIKILPEQEIMYHFIQYNTN